MAIAISRLATALVKKAVLDDVYTLLGRAFGQPLELDPGSPIAGILDAIVGWAVDDIWNPIVLPALLAPFLDYATGDWLSLIADLVYNRPRIDAQAGTQTVTFQNISQVAIVDPAVNGAAGRIRIKAVSGPPTGKTYTTTTPLSIAAWGGSGPYPTGTAIVEADIAGTASNAQTNQIQTGTTIPLVMGPVGCFVFSIAGAILGLDEETDPNLVERCRLAVSEASDMGPRAEYTSIALDPVGAFTRRNLPVPSTFSPGLPSISRVAVLEPGNAVVNVYLASSSGPAGGSANDPTTDLGKAAFAIQSFVVPPGTTCNVAAATSHSITLTSIVITLSAASNVSVPSAVAYAVAGINTFFSTLPIGGSRLTNGGTGYVFANAIVEACWGPGVIDVSVGAFADVALASNEVATFALPANPTSVISAVPVAQGN